MLQPARSSCYRDALDKAEKSARTAIKLCTENAAGPTVVFLGLWALGKKDDFHGWTWMINWWIWWVPKFQTKPFFLPFLTHFQPISVISVGFWRICCSRRSLVRFWRELSRIFKGQRYKPRTNPEADSSPTTVLFFRGLMELSSTGRSKHRYNKIKKGIVWQPGSGDGWTNSLGSLGSWKLSSWSSC